MSMPITKLQYNDMKEYWDFQRKVQYNKETISKMADKFEGRIFNEMGPVNIEQLKEMLWTKVRPDEYEDPPKDWIPEDIKLRFEWE